VVKLAACCDGAAPAVAGGSLTVAAAGRRHTYRERG